MLEADTDVIAEYKNWLICSECGALQENFALDNRTEISCVRCGKTLRSARAAWLELCAALTFSSLLLFILSNTFNFLTVEIAGQVHSATLLSGVNALLVHNQWVLAGLVLTTIFLYPLFEIVALLYVLVPYLCQRHVRGQATTFRWLIKAAPWSMLDVFLLGALVTAVKMGDLAKVEVGAGGYLFFVLVVMLNLAFRLIDREQIWNWINPNNCYTQGRHSELYDCELCKALVCVSLAEKLDNCPRCRAPLHRRTPQSLQKTLALLVAATILYIPANLLPIMVYSELDVNYSATIMAGVIELAENNLWGIATIVFIASVLVPVAKLSSMYFLIWSIHNRKRSWIKHRALLYRITEVIGRWSMVDVFVVTLLTAVVQFGFIGVVQPGPALLPFAGVVLLTMLAAEAFDPRLIWDSAKETIAYPTPPSGASKARQAPLGDR